MLQKTWFERDLVGDTSGHERAAKLWFSSSATAATRNRAGQLLALLVVIAAAVTGILALLLVVPVIFVILFGIAFFDRRTRRTALGLARILPIDLPDSSSFSDARARAIVDRLGRSRVAIGSVVQAGPRGAAFDLGGALDAIPRLERDLVVLASRIEYLTRLRGSMPASLTVEKVARAAARPLRPDPLAGLDAHAEILVGRAEDVLRALGDVPARITGLQLRRLEVCDDAIRARGETVSGLINGFEALDRALHDEGRYGDEPPRKTDSDQRRDTDT